MFHLLADPNYWRKCRKEYMQGARDCRDALRNPDGMWRYQPGDPRLKEAVMFWVRRARNCHAMALGRKPVISNLLVISDDNAARGSLYAAEQVSAGVAA